MVNVRLQHIADEAFISIGNLAYHYSNKESIVCAIYRELVNKQKDVLREYLLVPLFENMNRIFARTFILQRENIFFYLDTLEIIRAYSTIQKTSQQHIKWQIEQWRAIIDFNVSRGSFAGPQEPLLQMVLAKQIWMIGNLWFLQQKVHGASVDDIDGYISEQWALFQPYFSNTGKLEFRQMHDDPYGFYSDGGDLT